jgi:DNA-binding NarL/FixJ family response regulator
VQVLVVDDNEPWCRFFSTTIQQRPELQVVSEASDGLEAVQQAQQLQPGLILLDIGLPGLNGIAAARKIREISPLSKILFVSENRSVEIVKEALSTGAGGYVVKSDAATELLPAVEAVLQGRQFVSRSLAGRDFSDPPNERILDCPPHTNIVPPRLKRVESARQHVVGFYSNDRCLSDALTQFVGAALKAGNAAIVAATESHRDGLLPRLQAYGVDVNAAIEQGRYIALDAAETLSAFMVKDSPDPVRFLELLGDLIVTATEAAYGDHPRVSVFGECVHLLWAQGNTEAAIQLERLGNKLTKIHEVDILCGYSLGRVESGMDDHIFQRICAEHSAVYSL